MIRTYMILNHNNKIRYIGQTSQKLKYRLKKHMSEKKSNYRFTRDIKLGHKFTIREIKGDEFTLIKKHKCISSNKYYNLAKGGIGSLPGKLNHFYGRKHSIESRNKISIANKGNIVKITSVIKFSKPFTCGNATWFSSRACAKYYNLKNKRTIKLRLISKTNKFKEWRYL